MGNDTVEHTIAREIEKQGKSIVGELHTHQESRSRSTPRDFAIMKRVEFRLWIIAGQDDLYAIEFEGEDFGVSWKSLPSNRRKTEDGR